MTGNDGFEQSLGMTLRAGVAEVESAERLWQDLMVTAEHRGPRLGGRALAEQVNNNPFADQFATSLGVTLGRILVSPEEAESRRVQADVSEFIVHLRPALVSGLLRADPDARRRGLFFERAVEQLTLGAAYRLVSALAALVGRPLSEPLRNQFRSQAKRLDVLAPEVRPEAEEPLRATLRGLVESLHASAPGSPGGGGLPRVATARQAGRAVPEAERIVQLAIEINTEGPAVWIALAEMVAAETSRGVVDLVKRAPDGATVTAPLMKRVATTQELARLLEHDPVDEDAVDAFLHGLGIAAARVMLEAVVESRSRSTRRFLLDRLAQFGPQIQPLIEGRLRDGRWFVQRNMIALLRVTQCAPDNALATRFLQNTDDRVRREAVLWCLEAGPTRERAIVEGLKDPSAEVLRPTLQAARAGLPQAAVPVLAKRVLEADYPPGFRVLSLGLLGRSGNALALEALLHFAISGRTLIGRPKLAAKSPEMLAAVTALARTWRGDRRAGGVLEQARRSRDPQIIAAAKTGSVEMS